MIACLEQRFLPESEAATGTSGDVDAATRFLPESEAVAVSSGDAAAPDDHEEDLALLRTLKLHGSIEFPSVFSPPPPAARDFGGVYQHHPAAVVRPASTEDIATVVRLAARSPSLTVAARGNGHSIYGQAMAPGGVVLEMRPSLSGMELVTDGSPGDYPAVRAGGGALWEDVLLWCLANHRMAPKSWVDYLGLTVGGTLSVGGVSGQAFRHGPQCCNVLELEVVTGGGETVVCSQTLNPDLFFAALGGLGQFGVITRATIPLQPAPDMVRWVRVVYAEFGVYAGDAEWLVSRAAAEAGDEFDYVEGFAFVNGDDPINGWDSVPLAPGQRFVSARIPPGSGPLLYCLEVGLHYTRRDSPDAVDERVARMLGRLSHLRELEFAVDVSYEQFLLRVKRVEEDAMASGIWDAAAHPWLNLFVSKSDIADFDRRVFKHILHRGVGGPMLVYPLLKSKWDPRVSVSLPAGDVFYLVALLRFSQPPPVGPSAKELVAQNQKVVDCCVAQGYDFKLYLPHYGLQEQWRRHFGEKWCQFAKRKARYDPLGILSPGQRIFSRARSPPRADA